MSAPLSRTLEPLNRQGFMDMTTASSTASNKLNYFSMLNLDNPVFCCFLFWTSVLVIKMLLMSLLTALQRFRFKILRLFPKNLVKVEFFFFEHLQVCDDINFKTRTKCIDFSQPRGLIFQQHRSTIQ